MGEKKVFWGKNSLRSIFSFGDIYKFIFGRKNNQGFTLVELLVVLVILAVLGGIILTLLNPKKYIDQAKDAKRTHDLVQIQSALDTYYNDHNCYPVSLDALNSGQTIYMKDIPKDPDTFASYPYEVDVSTACPQWNILFAKVSTKSNMRSICPLDQFSDCIPPNLSYDNSAYICVLSGKIDCAYVKSNEMPGLIAPTPTGVLGPTPTPTLNSTPTTPFGGPTNTPTPTGFLTPTPTGITGPTPTFPPPPTPTPTPCLKIYACRPTCNQLDTPADDGYCSPNCNGACP